jgi:hypothetical protein
MNCKTSANRNLDSNLLGAHPVIVPLQYSMPRPYYYAADSVGTGIDPCY